MNGVLGVAVLDSGARVTSINRKFVVAAGLDPDSAVFREGDPTLGATMTPVSTRIGPIGTVVFAGITRSNVSAKVVDLPYLKGAGLAGVPAVNLGVDLLQGTRLRVDYAARRFRLAPSSCAASLSQ
ncbi:MAG: aspartyl protease family protein [Aliidongia sp.]